MALQKKRIVMFDLRLSGENHLGHTLTNQPMDGWVGYKKQHSIVTTPPYLFIFYTFTTW